MEFGLLHPRTIKKMFKTAKHVALAIEQPDRKSTMIKDIVDVNKGDKPKFDLCQEAHKSTFDKGKSFTSGSRMNSKPSFNSSGKNRVRRTKMPFRLNIPIENVAAVLKEKYGVKDPPPLNPHTEGVRDRSRYCDFH